MTFCLGCAKVSPKELLKIRLSACVSEIFSFSKQATIQDKLCITENRAQGIEAKHGVIKEQRKEMQEAIKSQLNLIKQLKVWRLAEALRRFFFQVIGRIYLIAKRDANN